jgi:hypothetical protein
MLPYWIVFVFLATLSFLSFTTKLSKLMLIGYSLVSIIFLIGLRDQTGSDWNHYKNFFNNLNTSSEIINNFEFGYIFYSRIFKYFFENYYFFLFISTFIYIYFFVKSIYVKHGVVFTLLGLYSSHLLPLMGQSRQVIAVSLCALAGNYLLNKNKLYFFILVIIATAFHKSAIVFILSFFLLEFRFKIKHLYYCLIFFLAYPFLVAITPIFINFLFNIFPVIGHQLIAYFVSDDNTPIFYIEDSVMLALLYFKRILFALFFIFVGKFIFKFRREYFFYCNIYILSLLLFLSIYPLFPAIAIRLSLYFYIYDVFMLSIILLNQRKQYKLFVFFCFLLIFAQRLWQPLFLEADFLMPYKGIVFNSDVPDKSMPD